MQLGDETGGDLMGTPRREPANGIADTFHAEALVEFDTPTPCPRRCRAARQHRLAEGELRVEHTQPTHAVDRT